MYQRHTRVGFLRDEFRVIDTFITVKWDDKRLSITGVVGPKGNGDSIGSCGQCHDTLKDPDFYAYEGIDTNKLHEIWKRWHLNDRRAECEHQREDWDLEVPTDELISKPCEVCGYKYGSAWLKEDVPPAVVEWLQALPDDSSSLCKAWR